MNALCGMGKDVLVVVRNRGSFCSWFAWGAFIVFRLLFQIVWVSVFQHIYQLCSEPNDQQPGCEKQCGDARHIEKEGNKNTVFQSIGGNIRKGESAPKGHNYPLVIWLLKMTIYSGFSHLKL